MFGGDDDDDFLPANNSKLASLFSSESGGGGNASLTYTAPKQPKNVGGGKQESRSSSKTSSGSTASSTAQSSASNTLGHIVIKAVDTYKKLEDGTYHLQGKLAAAILENPAIILYQLLLYKGKRHHISKTKITPKFQFILQPNNCGTFYDDQKQNWSLHFEQDDDVEEFAKEIGLARGNSQGGNGGIHNLLAQDLSTGEGPPANVGDSMEIFYSVRLFTDRKLGQMVENNLQADKPQRVKIRKNVWEEGLIGATKGSKRIILLPPNLVGPWKRSVPADSSVAVEVQVGRLKRSRDATVDSGESAVDLSADDSGAGIRARGVSIADALSASPKTSKAEIISRMARMGQATLPLKGAITCDPSDTEDSEEDANSKKAAIVFKPSPKVRSATTPPQPPPPEKNHAVTMPPQQMAVYQSVPAWLQQSQQAFAVGQYGISQLDGQLYPLVSSPTVGSNHQLMAAVPSTTSTGMPKATDSHLSVFLSEARTHNTEVRIGMAKVADKVDQVLAKLDSSHTLRPAGSGALLDSTTLLASITKLVSDNEQLRTELADKGSKIDAQNDRIYQLLNTNHKYLEQSNTTSADQRNHEATVAELRRDRARLSEEAAELTARLERCERDAARRDGERDAKLAAKLAERDETVAKVMGSLVETRRDNDALRASLDEATQKLAQQKRDADEEITRLKEASLAAERKPSEPSASNRQVFDEVKKVMNIVYKSLHREFVNGESYLGENVRETLAVTIRDITCQLIEKEMFVVTAPTKSRPAQSSASEDRREKSRPTIGVGEMSKENVVVSTESSSSTVDGSNHSGNDVESKSVSAGYGGMPKELLVCQSEPISKPAVNLSSAINALRKDTGSATTAIGQAPRETSVVPSEPHFNTVEDLNPTADGPKAVDESSSDVTANYAGDNAGDIPTVPLAKLPGETDLSVGLVYTDSDTMPESIAHLRVTSDLCVPGTSPTPKVPDNNRRELKSAAVSEAGARPVVEPSTSDALNTSNQQQSTNEENEIVEENLRESSLERKPWRSEPPPLFDDDEDEDDWLS